MLCCDVVSQVSLELGGNEPCTIFKGSLAGKYRSTGQTCVCINRILVQDVISEWLRTDLFENRHLQQVAEAFTSAVSELRVANGLEQGITKGPLINEAALSKVERHVQDAVSKKFVKMLAAPLSLNNVPAMTPSKSWPYFDPEYDTMSSLIDPPKVLIDNDTEKNATLVKVSSQNKHGTLLEVVQELMDMDLTISKAYISSDGGWFMDVFHVTDARGRKIRDLNLIGKIEKALTLQKKKWTAEFQKCPGRCIGTQTIAEHTAIELTGTDRPGLLSEVSAVLAEMYCRVNAAEVWTHKRRVACVIYVTDEDTLGPIENVLKLERILEKLKPIMQGYDTEKAARSVVAESFTHVERRLHQLMLADHDFDLPELQSSSTVEKKDQNIDVNIGNENNYSVVNVKCPDRPKLLFDTVCTLTDLKYVVFHATIDSSGPYAVQEYHIRKMDGQTLDNEEKEKVKKCLEAAIERRSSEGLRLDLCTSDRAGLLTEVTRIFRENGLSVTRADVSTQGEKAVNTFYVTDVNGRPVDLKTVENIRKENPLLGVHAVPPASEVPRALDSSPFSKFIKTSERILQGLGWRV